MGSIPMLFTLTNYQRKVEVNPQEELQKFENQPTLTPGQEGYWKVWGARVSNIRPNDIILTKQGDDSVCNFITDTFTSKAYPMRMGFVDENGERFTLGAMSSVVVVRLSTHNILAD